MKFGSAKIAAMTSGPPSSSLGDPESGSLLDPYPVPESRLGAKLEASLVPDDPDDRAFWIWDPDDLEMEPCP